MNSAGIHCRPSALIIKAALESNAKITIETPRGTCELCSVLELISLGLEEGTRITVRVSGEDEEAVCQRMVDLFETAFDFPPQ